MRAHLIRPITDEAGNLLYGAVVTVREQAVAVPLGQTLFSAPSGSSALPNPFVASNAYVDVWLDTPARVNVLITYPGRADLVVYLDAQPPASEVVRALSPLTITAAPVAGKILTGTSGTEADWEDPPAPVGGVPPHYHQGAGTNSVALGVAAVAPSTDSTAIGDGAQAQALESTALGNGATAIGPHSTALGASASTPGDSATAVGFQAVANAQYGVSVGYSAQSTASSATAIGAQSQATQAFATALGYQAVASGVDAAAVGHGASAAAPSSVALGAGATVAAGHTNSVAVGPAVATTAADQIKLGAATHSVLVLGELRALADAIIAGSGGKVGFFGSSGATKQVVTGSRGGNTGLASLLTHLATIGLITDSTTA